MNHALYNIKVKYYNLIRSFSSHNNSYYQFFSLIKLINLVTILQFDYA